MRQRVGALVFRDKKLLLVTGYDLQHWWTPGGMKEEGESDADALTREVQEELGASITIGEQYFSFLAPPFEDRPEMMSTYYYVDLEGEGLAQAEVTSLGWYSKEDIDNGVVVLFPAFMDQVLPRLIADNLL